MSRSDDAVKKTRDAYSHIYKHYAANAPTTDDAVHPRIDDLLNICQKPARPKF